VALVVFGRGGGARQSPEGFSKQEAFQHLVREMFFVTASLSVIVGPRTTSPTIAIAPLLQQETNQSSTTTNHHTNDTTHALAWVDVGAVAIPHYLT